MSDWRNSMLAKIHMAKKQLGLTDEEYRDVIEVKTGERSAAKLNHRQLDQILRHFSRMGFQERIVRARKGDKSAPSNQAMSRKAMLSKIEALLAEIGSQEGRHVPWDYAAAILQRMFKVERLDWAKPDQLRAVIAALHRKAYGTKPEEIAENLLIWRETLDPEEYARTYDWQRHCTGTRTWAKVELIIKTRLALSTSVQPQAAGLNG